MGIQVSRGGKVHQVASVATDGVTECGKGDPSGFRMYSVRAVDCKTCIKLCGGVPPMDSSESVRAHNDAWKAQQGLPVTDAYNTLREPKHWTEADIYYTWDGIRGSLVTIHPAAGDTLPMLGTTKRHYVAGSDAKAMYRVTPEMLETYRLDNMTTVYAPQPYTARCEDEGEGHDAAECVTWDNGVSAYLCTAHADFREGLTTEGTVRRQPIQADDAVELEWNCGSCGPQEAPGCHLCYCVWSGETLAEIFLAEYGPVAASDEAYQVGNRWEGRGNQRMKDLYTEVARILTDQLYVAALKPTPEGPEGDSFFFLAKNQDHARALMSCRNDVISFGPLAEIPAEPAESHVEPRYGRTHVSSATPERKRFYRKHKASKSHRRAW